MDAPPPAKKKIVKKVSKKKQVSSFPEYVVEPSNKTLKTILEGVVAPKYVVENSPDEWMLRNRAKFPTWLDKQFRNMRTKPSPAPAVGSINLFTHQRFIKDYIQFDSPYRGMLIYHGLGVGKSCSSIAAAEILANHMDVVVMTPASLRDNYLNEMRKCGRQFYNTKQHWGFMPFDSVADSELHMIARKMKIDYGFMKDQGGVWLPVPGKPTNYDDMSNEVKKSIEDQIQHIMSNAFGFINYNGLNNKRLQEIYDAAGGNPFDDKCVIVDEIHNLVSQICNGKQLGMAMYRLIMNAKNCKLIFLSGTPLINYPHEIAVLVNMLTGHQVLYELSAKREFDQDTVAKVLRQHKYVDTFELDIRAKKLRLSLLPIGFAKTGVAPGHVAREHIVGDRPTPASYIEDVVSDLERVGTYMNNKWTTKEILTLPQDQDTFNEYFVDFNRLEMKNALLFMRRILGLVSFYSTYSLELYPSVIKEDVELEMNDHQFNMYEKARAKERIKEKNSKRAARGGDGGLFANMGQVYRFYSRALCNFVFPENIERPFPSNMRAAKNELDVDDEEPVDDAVDTKSPGEKDINKEYLRLLNQAVEKLVASGALKMDTITEHSAKYKAIYDRIQSIHGSALVYSQFRKVEGLGLFGMFLKENGWCELKVAKDARGEWIVDIPEEDYAKPKFIQFTGSNEETRLLLKIFNSDLENLPQNIRDMLPALGGENNHRGDIIKVIMITKSGAEGISLKNVRQVHVMEPYWNHIRIDQVIGRAVRTSSHIDLPRADRNVHVYVYCMKPTKKQIEGSFSIRSQDKGETSDQHIYNMAKKKAKIIDQFLDSMKRASIDCALNARHHNNLRCFSFPVNVDDDKLSYTANIKADMLNAQYKSALVANEWKGEVLMTKKGNFLIRRETQEVYDYDLYVESGRLVKLGVLRMVGTNRVIE